MSKVQSTEQMIQDKNLNAPRLTPTLIEAAIKEAVFHVFPGTMLTVCVLTLQNNFTVTGESACASPENFDEEIGRKIAHENARNKIWMLEGYLLKQKLHDEPESFVGRLEREYTELTEKALKLNEFIGTIGFESLGKAQRDLLIEQNKTMNAYSNILLQRMRLI